MFGLGSHVLTNQKRENGPFSLLIGRNMRPFPENFVLYRVWHLRGRISNFNQSEARKQCVLASDWLKFEPFPESTVLYKLQVLQRLAVHNIQSYLGNVN